MGEYSVIGKRLPRIDGPEKVNGEGKFTTDINLPNMLYGKILRSPYPHAKILSVDISKALKLSGVKAIVTGEDTKAPYGVLESISETMHEYPLKSDKVRYPGDEIAAVAAIDENIAEEALELIKVDYERLPAVFDPEEAMKDNAPRIHEDSPNNIGVKVSWDIGEVDKALSQAYYVREDRFVTQDMLHAPMEPHAAVASFDISGKLTVWCSTQVPYYVHRALARTLQIDEGRIRVIKPHVGGGFGGKWEPLTDSICAAFLSLKAGRPVKLVFTREEEFIGTHRRHPEIVYLKTGVSKDGKILVRDSKVILDGGAYNSCGHVTAYLSGGFQTLPYRIPNYRYEGIRVFTNKAPCGAMRGHGGVQPQYAADIQLDIIAEEIGMDPLDLRKMNSLMPGDVTTTNYKISSCGFKECLEKGGKASDYKNKRKALFGSGRGIGIGSNGFVSGTSIRVHSSAEAFSSAQIRLHEDGSVTLLTGASDIGQGSNTVLAMIAAEELGVELKDMKVIYSDTGVTPIDMGSYSSRVTLFAGNAVKSAASELKKVLLEVSADRLEANIDDVEIKNGRIYIKGSPGKGFAFKEIVSYAQRAQRGKPLIATGSYTPPGVDLLESRGDPTQGPVSPTYSFGAHFAEVEIDKNTGELNILNFIATHDCGFQINPMAVEGQLEGSVIMGSGYALTEKLHINDGIPLNPSFLGYKILTAVDIPKGISSIVVETIEPNGPFGAKEASEGTLNPTPGAIANAVYNAVGVRIKELPITPEKILRKLEEKS